MSDSFATPWTVDYQVPRSWNFPGQNTGVWPFPSPGDLPVPGIEPMSLAYLALADGFFTTKRIRIARDIS